jgi:hypothetical protein
MRRRKEERAGELGARWRRKSGEGAASGRGKMQAMGSGRCYRETERGKQEEEDEDLFVNFAKVQGVH